MLKIIETKRILKIWSDRKMRNWSEQLVDKDQILLITAVTCLYTLFFSSLFHSQFSLAFPTLKKNEHTWILFRFLFFLHRSCCEQFYHAGSGGQTFNCKLKQQSNKHDKTYLFRTVYWWSILYSVLTCMHRPAYVFFLLLFF